MTRGVKILTPEIKEKRLKTKAENREKRNQFFIKINNRFRISKDAYNIILSEKVKTEDTGRVYDYPKGYFGKFGGAIVDLVRENGATEEELQRYSERVKVLTPSYRLGKLHVDFPKDFVFDVRDPDEAEPVEEPEEEPEEEPKD